MSFFSLLLLFDVFIRISFDKMILFFFVCCRMLKMLFILFIAHLFVVVRGGIMEFGWCECEVGNECRNSDEIQQNITYVICSSGFFYSGDQKICISVLYGMGLISKAFWIDCKCTNTFNSSNHNKKVHLFPFNGFFGFCKQIRMFFFFFERVNAFHLNKIPMLTIVKHSSQEIKKIEFKSN